MSTISPPEHTDAELMRRVAARDRAAFAAVYDRHAGAVFGLARRMLGPVAAEEVVQECFLGLWRAPAKYHPERGSLRAFLLAVVRNRAIDVLRAEVRRAGAPDAATTHHEPADEAAARRESARALRTALAALPPAQREALVLAYLGGLTQAEIARRLSVPIGTVKGRIRLGLRRLRAELEPAAQPTV